MRTATTGTRQLWGWLPVLTSVTLLGLLVSVALDLLLGVLPPHYSVIYQPESADGVDPYSYLMEINVVVRGLLSLALVVAVCGVAAPLVLRVGAALLGLWAMGSILVAALPPAGMRVGAQGGRNV